MKIKLKVNFFPEKVNETACICTHIISILNLLYSGVTSPYPGWAWVNVFSILRDMLVNIRCEILSYICLSRRFSFGRICSIPVL